MAVPLSAAAGPPGWRPALRVNVVASTGEGPSGRTRVVVADAEVLATTEAAPEGDLGGTGEALLRVTAAQALRVTAALNFAREVRLLARPRDEVGDGAAPARGRAVIGPLVVAGASGGCGASLVAGALALRWAAAGGRPWLVELDLERGDLAGAWGLPADRTIADLVPVAAELDGGHLRAAALPHPSGVSLLPGPGAPGRRGHVGRRRPGTPRQRRGGGGAGRRQRRRGARAARAWSPPSAAEASWSCALPRSPARAGPAGCWTPSPRGRGRPGGRGRQRRPGARRDRGPRAREGARRHRRRRAALGAPGGQGAQRRALGLRAAGAASTAPSTGWPRRSRDALPSRRSPRRSPIRRWWSTCATARPATPAPAEATSRARTSQTWSATWSPRSGGS